MKKYEWRALSQWDITNKKFYVKYKEVNSGLSKCICTFLLVEVVDYNESGYKQTKPVLKTNVTKNILDIAGKI